LSKIWNLLNFKTNSEYDFKKLIDYQLREKSYPQNSNVHIICDIDKTYLETELDSIFHMARVAFESANDKITVSGASEFLLAARWGENNGEESRVYPRNLHFVSSSPPQLRSVLERKLTMDGLDWNSETFKNQAYNVKQRRFNMLKHHIGYKTAAILSLIKKSQSGSKFYLIGDNSESDAYIYLGIALRLRNKLTVKSFQKYLEVAGVSSAVASEISETFLDLPKASVEAILIRCAPNYESTSYPRLTDGIRHFDNYLQAAFIFIQHQLIPEELLFPLCKTFHNNFWFQRSQIINHLNSFLKSATTPDIKEVILEVTKQFSKIDTTMPSETISANLSPCDFSYLDDLQEDECLGLAKEWLSNSH